MNASVPSLQIDFPVGHPVENSSNTFTIVNLLPSGSGALSPVAVVNFIRAMRFANSVEGEAADK